MKEKFKFAMQTKEKCELFKNLFNFFIFYDVNLKILLNICIDLFVEKKK